MTRSPCRQGCHISHRDGRAADSNTSNVYSAANRSIVRRTSHQASPPQYYRSSTKIVSLADHSWTIGFPVIAFSSRGPCRASPTSPPSQDHTLDQARTTIIPNLSGVDLVPSQPGRIFSRGFRALSRGWISQPPALPQKRFLPSRPSTMLQDS